MLRITTITIIFGMALVQTSTIKAEDDADSRLSLLEQQVRSQQEQVDLLKQQQEYLSELLSEKKIYRFQDVVDKFQGRHRSDILAPAGRHLRSTDPDEVAFTAKLNQKLNNIPVHTTIKFDFLVYQTGDYYNNNTGVFTCPTSGLYLFAVFVESNTLDVEAAVTLMLDGGSYMTIVSERSDIAEDDTGGNLVLLSVNKGQRVWVETYHHDNQALWPGFTTFSGVLLHRT